MVVLNELVFVLMIVTEGLLLHSKYKENILRAVHSIGYSILLFKTLNGMGFSKSPTSANTYCSILNFLQTFTPLSHLSVLSFCPK